MYPQADAQAFPLTALRLLGHNVLLSAPAEESRRRRRVRGKFTWAYKPSLNDFPDLNRSLYDEPLAREFGHTFINAKLNKKDELAKGSIFQGDLNFDALPAPTVHASDLMSQKADYYSQRAQTAQDAMARSDNLRMAEGFREAALSVARAEASLDRSIATVATVGAAMDVVVGVAQLVVRQGFKKVAEEAVAETNAVGPSAPEGSKLYLSFTVATRSSSAKGCLYLLTLGQSPTEAVYHLRSEARLALPDGRVIQAARSMIRSQYTGRNHRKAIPAGYEIVDMLDDRFLADTYEKALQFLAQVAIQDVRYAIQDIRV